MGDDFRTAPYPSKGSTLAELRNARAGEDDPPAAHADPVAGHAEPRTTGRLELRIREAITGQTSEAIRIDRFLVLEQLGAGGMGVVYAAFDPKLDRKVALKIVRADREAARERVLAEARALARLSHPNVVAVYDASEYEGELFIAMELVQGDNLRRWLAAQRRSIREIVAVFVQAGRGLVAAHDAELIHGDVKPENILVGDGIVKVADFGLARAEDTPAKARGGTPGYMAPEQVAGVPPDARSDQYAFAASLYEAIHGSRPSPATEGTSRTRLVAPRRVARVLGRALSPDPAARFPSMAALLAALSPAPSRLRRWGLIAAAPAIGVAALVLGRTGGDPCGGAEDRIAAIWSPAVRAKLPAMARRPLDEYSRSWAQMAHATCEATRRGEQSTALLDLRTSCLDRRLDELGELVTVLARSPQSSDTAAAAAFALSPIEPCADRDRLAGVLPPPPAQRAVVAALRTRIDRSRARLDTAESAAALADLEGVVVMARSLRYAPVLGEALLVRGMLQHRAGKYLDADGSFQAAAEAAAAGHDDDVLTTVWTKRAYTLGVGLQRRAEGLAYLEAADAIVARATHATLQRADILQARGEILAQGDRQSEARTALAQAVALFEQGGGVDHPSVANALRQLSKLCVIQGDLAAARSYAERARAILSATLGPEQHEVVALLDSLGSIAFGERDLPRALAYYRELLDHQLVLGDDNPAITATRGNIGNVLRMLGRYDEARVELERALAIARRTTGLDNDVAIGLLWLLAKTTRDPVLAKRQLEDVLARKIALLGPTHSSVADAINSLGNAARERGELAEAAADFARALAIYEKALGAQHPRVAIALSNLGELALARGRFGEARERCSRAQAIDEARLGVKHPELAFDLACIGEARLGLGDVQGAIELLERALALNPTPEPDDRARRQFALARALWASGRDHARARELARAAVGDALPSLKPAVERWLAAHDRPAP